MLRETVTAKVLVYNAATRKGENTTIQLVYEIEFSMVVPAYRPIAD